MKNSEKCSLFSSGPARYFRVSLNRLLLAHVILFSLVFLIPAALHATDNEKVEPALKSSSMSIEEKWGIEIKSVTLTSNGHMIDVRYIVKEAEKAKPFLSPDIKPYLIDSASGMKSSVPTTPKVGSLRQKTKIPQNGREYFMLFVNPGMRIRPESKVTLVVGDIRIENIVVR